MEAYERVLFKGTREQFQNPCQFYEIYIFV